MASRVQSTIGIHVARKAIDRHKRRGRVGARRVLQVRFQPGELVGRSVMYACDGKKMGGNSAFAHIGTYVEIGDDRPAPSGQ